MKINGKVIARETRRVSLHRSDDAGGPIEVTVASITVGVRRDFDALWPRPKVPLIVTQGKAGREEKEDWRNEKFQEELEERTMAQNVYLMYRVLELDPNVKFDTKPTDKESLKALMAEVKESGLADGDIVVILREALAASNVTQAEIDQIKTSF